MIIGQNSHVPKPRVLVVDSDLDTVESTVLLFQSGGYETRTASDGVEAVERVATYRPDIVLLDLAIPRLDGYAVARTIRERPPPQQPILIATTSYADKASKLKSAETGFDLHLSKPVDLAVFEELPLLLQQSGRLRAKFSELKAVHSDAILQFIRLEVEMASIFLDVAANTTNPETKHRCLAKMQCACDRVARWITQGGFGDGVFGQAVADLQRRYGLLSR